MLGYITDPATPSGLVRRQLVETDHNGRVTLPIRRWVSGWLVSMAMVMAVSGVIELLKAHAPVWSLAVLYLFAVLPVAIVWGVAFAVVVSVASMVAFNFLFLPPLYSFTFGWSQDWSALVVFLVTAVVVSELAARSRRRAGQAARLAEEQAALRRVATLVARGTPSGH